MFGGAQPFYMLALKTFFAYNKYFALLYISLRLTFDKKLFSNPSITLLTVINLSSQESRVTILQNTSASIICLRF